MINHYLLKMQQINIKKDSRIFIPFSGGKDGYTELKIFSNANKRKIFGDNIDIIVFTFLYSSVNDYCKTANTITSALCNNFGFKHLIINAESILGKELDHFKEGSKSQFGFCILCSLVRRIITEALLKYYDITHITCGRNKNDVMRHCIFSNILKSSDVSNTFDNVIPINGLEQFTEQEVALYSLDNDVLSHWNTPCQYEETGGQRTFQDFIVSQIDFFYPQNIASDFFIKKEIQHTNYKKYAEEIFKEYNMEDFDDKLSEFFINNKSYFDSFKN